MQYKWDSSKSIQLGRQSDRLDISRVHEGQVVFRNPIPSEMKDVIRTPVTLIEMEYRYGKTVDDMRILSKRIPLIRLIERDKLVIDTWDDHQVMINTAHVERACNDYELVSIISEITEDLPGYYYKKGTYRYSFLVIEGSEVITKEWER